MRGKKNFVLSLVIVLGLLLTTSFSFAATYTVDIVGLPNSLVEIEGFTFWFKVDPVFTFSTAELGDAVPTTGTLGWETDNNKIVVDEARRLYKFGAYDQDGLFLNNPQYLQSGTLFSFDYEGVILEEEGDFFPLALIEFTNEFGVNLYPDFVKLDSSDTSGAHFSAVPIPGTVLLLGSGLLGLMGIGRRRMKKS